MKRILCLSLALILAFSMAACGSEPEPVAETEPTDTTAPSETTQLDPTEPDPTEPSLPPVTQPVQTTPATEPSVSTPTEPAPEVTVPDETIPGPTEPEHTEHHFTLSSSKDPTCTESGYTIYACSGCDEAQTVEIPALGHSLTAATCTAAPTCTRCGATSGTALGHDYSQGQCTRCGKLQSSTQEIRVKIRNSEGETVSGITVQLFIGGSLVGTGVTDSSGVVKVTVDDLVPYQIKLLNVPDSLICKESYSFSSQYCNINLTVRPVIDPNDHSKANYQRGDTMGEFTLTDTDGNTYVLSELLKQKDLVILDFWFVSCGPCKSEFPHFESLLDRYGDRVTLLALNPIDTEAQIITLREELGSTFPMIRDVLNLSKGFKLTAYPTTVFIDSSGTIVYIQSGTVESEQALFDIVERYL